MKTIGLDRGESHPFRSGEWDKEVADCCEEVVKGRVNRRRPGNRAVFTELLLYMVGTARPDKHKATYQGPLKTNDPSPDRERISDVRQRILEVKDTEASGMPRGRKVRELRERQVGFVG